VAKVYYGHFEVSLARCHWMSRNDLRSLKESTSRQPLKPFLLSLLSLYIPNIMWSGCSVRTCEKWCRSQMIRLLYLFRVDTGTYVRRQVRNWLEILRIVVSVGFAARRINCGQSTHSFRAFRGVVGDSGDRGALGTATVRECV
jgi:hypothetical protein